MIVRLCHYFFRQALVNIISNRVIHVIGLGTMVVSLLIFGTFLLLFVNLNSWLEGWGQTLSVSIYLRDGVEQITRDKIASFIESLPGAEVRRFISKDVALRDLRTAVGAHSGLLDELSHNPLPASFEVVFKDVEIHKANPDAIKTKLEKLDGVQEVQYSEEWLKKFGGLMRVVKLIGFVIGGLLGMGVLFIVTNTIKLTIYSRRDEIEILKLVGATDWFVKIPFLLEGMIQGLVSSVFALSTLFLGYFFLSTEKINFFGLAAFDLVFFPREYVLSLFVASVVLGLGGSLIAVGRFFDV